PAAAENSLEQAPRVLAEGTVPDDARLGPLKDLDGYFPFRPCKTPEEWSRRAQRVRKQMQVALGLWPMPEKTPLNPAVYGKIDRGDYTVEKVHFESYPGFFVTGSLFRPKGKAGKLPAILTPHGHWNNGRFYDQGEEAVRREIVEGAERFEEGGRSPLQSRCVQLARMGCVVFFYDMLGYADSVQIPQSLAHGFSKQRPEMNAVENWGLFSPQAESHLQSVMGLQAWDSIRALDFLLSLPDVDPDRIGVTGASGGGTQTFILCALDPRPAVAFPAVMVSTAMQGGCTCENASLLRIDTGNVEFAAMFAPKPLGMTAADDWTKEMPSKGFPELKAHFAMMGAPENVMLKPLLHFGHNYNYVSRAAMYSWFNRHLHLGLREPIVEEDYQRLSIPEMSVWDEQHPKPEAGPDFERKLLRYLTESSGKQLNTACATLARYKEVVGGALEVMIGRNLEEAGEVQLQEPKTQDIGSCSQTCGLLFNSTYHEQLPCVILEPRGGNKGTVIWVDEHGKSGLFAARRPTADVQKLLDSGLTVIAADLLLQGEFLHPGEGTPKNRVVNNPREFAGYTYCYNRPLFAQRVDDLMSLIKYARSRSPGANKVLVAGFRGAGPWVGAAVAQAGGTIQAAAIDTAGFRFGKLLDYQDPGFLPGGAKYGDLPGILALCAPTRLWLAGEGQPGPGITRALYEKANATEHLTAATGSPEEIRARAIDYLITQAGG
ncbi:MAG TPA: acetylxylan esterase, partial [Verrucomicrobiae bacterium]|nr:acetylxylan esterase [Verrucomicrobiae bacterium]